MKDMHDAFENMTLEELWELFPITLSDHNPRWREWADSEIGHLRVILEMFSSLITHIGSTAIPRIKAKPIVDILVEVPDDCGMPAIRDIMEESGYICMSVTENRMSFNKGYTPDGYAEKVFHIHVHRVGDNDEIRFRDYLIRHDEIAKEYETLKHSLISKYRKNRDAYTDAKSEFVKRIVMLAKDDEQGLSQAIRLYKDIIYSGCDGFFKAEAYYKTGCAYNDLGEGEKAFASFRKAAKLDCHEAYAKIGDAYRYGNGIEQDEAQARKWYRKGADVGEITATLNLAECYKNGIGGEQDYEKAMDEYLHIAERLNGRGFKHQMVGIGTALYEIGNMYLNGLGVQPDLRKAIHYFNLSVKKSGNGWAENKLNELL